ncbi:ABC transporter permease [Actinopolymorpha singaporensis]|uniref:Peptide/nickel transport system permease protein n=1 Tax=Actinopolymorpha singaporensis TaxID=117157 RepID=A0A1H1USD0_9ACTN|nr:ABC transporter permease [Actinopolymorpha singaporensis]SDS75415.1 peptide/nickel transport system permease protein [Actinopolymorpha singaporensis]
MTAVTDGPPATGQTSSEIYVASQRKLIWWRFRKNRLAVAGAVVLGLVYLLAAFCEFWAPATPDTYRATYSYAPPQRIHVSFQGGLHFFVDDYRSQVSRKTLLREFTPDPNQRVALRFFPHGEKYKLWGVFPTTVHFFGPVQPGRPLYLLGADEQGRDLLTRLIYGSRVSMSVGLIGVGLGLVLGTALGGVSGYFGGVTDTLIQRIIEFIMSVPTLPLWLGLAAAVPPGWGPIKTYFAITLILSLIGWTGLARVIRSRFLQIRSEDYVLAAELDGVRRSRIIGRHMLPAFTSHIIATLTLSIPGMILGETALSFLGLGLQPPVVSWGVLLQDAQNIRVLSTAPWLLLSGAAVVIAVVALNFLGDGLRDAADPYDS